MKRRTQRTVDEISDLQWLLAQLDSVTVCEHTQARFRALLQTMVGRNVFFSRRELERPEHIAAATSLIEAGCTRAEARDRLHARFGVSRAQAYRLLSAALAARASRQGHARQKAGLTAQPSGF